MGPNETVLIVLHRVVSRNRHVINEVFDRFDRDGNGFLNAKELTAFMTTSTAGNRARAGGAA